ncbi:hypothetical protein QBC38DRAFT_539607 [Podospora fimiseda]|uniref:Uncharacterized protein n=1 Tax=Podospora fimiseda TaxID=252190 RepID=A0AAN6YR52_9PEZI|nr:hypothetical protein QBC38DRAFT_539607 [Podospora fimiseda]
MTWTTDDFLKGYEGPGYQPVIPQSYSGCVFDPTSITRIALLTSNALAIHRLRHGAPTNAPPGLYDIRTTLDAGSRLYLAVFEDGGVGWVNRSSNGQNPVDIPPQDEFITTIWSLQRNGIATAGILGGIQFNHPQDPPVPRLYFTPRLYMKFEEACNIHDTCWATCNSSFGACNNNFLNNLYNLCVREFSQYSKSLTGCNNLAQIYYIRSTVSTSGLLWLEEQRKYYRCVGLPF